MKGQLIVASQKLIDLVAKCLYQESVGTTSLSADGLLQATHSGTQLFSFCSALASHINDTRCIERAISSLTVDWVVLGACRTLLDWQMLSLANNDRSTRNASEKVSFKTLMSTYLNINRIDFTPKPSPSPMKKLSDDSRLLNRSLNNATPIKKNVNKKNGKGETALHLACKKNDLPTVKTLLSHSDIDVNCADNAGWTALHEACFKGHVNIVKELLAYRSTRTITYYFSPGKQPACKRVDASAVSLTGVTPLHDAVRNGHVQVAKLLIASGGRDLLELEDAQGRTPQDYASDEMKAELSDTTDLSLSGALEKIKVSSVCCGALMSRYLSVLFEFVSRYLSLKLGEPFGPCSDADYKQLVEYINQCVIQLRCSVQLFLSDQLDATHLRLLGMLECLGDCV